MILLITLATARAASLSDQIAQSDAIGKSIIALLVALFGLAAAGVKLAVAWINRKIQALQAEMTKAVAAASEANASATAARFELQNNHTINLRDDLDKKDAAQRVRDARAFAAIEELSAAQKEHGRQLNQIREWQNNTQADLTQLRSMLATANDKISGVADDAADAHAEIDSRLDALETP